jgi:hypothetical protein
MVRFLILIEISLEIKNALDLCLDVLGFHALHVSSFYIFFIYLIRKQSIINGYVNEEIRKKIVTISNQKKLQK